MKTPSLSPHRSGDPSRPSRRHRGPSAALLVAVVALSLVMLVGCGRLRHATAGHTGAVPTITTVAPTSTAPGSSTTAAASSSDNQTLDSISQQLATVDSSLNAANGDLQTADSAINSQEGDPSK